MLWQLPHFIKYGFPLDFPYLQEALLNNDPENHASTTTFPQHVDNYLHIELAHGAIIFFSDPPYGNSIHISAFMSRDKQDIDTRCMIIDMSWPIANLINYFTLQTYIWTLFINYSIPLWITLQRP